MFRRSRGDADSASGDLVATMIVLPVIVWVLFSIIDIGMYFSQRAAMSSIVRASTAQVAYFGGTGDRFGGTELATPREYSVSALNMTAEQRASCIAVSNTFGTLSEATTPNKGKPNPAECRLITAITTAKEFSRVHVRNVWCEPNGVGHNSVFAPSAGDPDGFTVPTGYAKCSVVWRMYSITGPMSLGSRQTIVTQATAPLEVYYDSNTTFPARLIP